MQNTIKQAAAGLYREHAAEFTLDDLCKHAGLSRATLYRRIGSKEKLLKQMFEEGLIAHEPDRDIDGRIFAATRIVVASHGFIACTMEQIAKESGLGVATLYRHFNDKENLLKSFIAQLKPMLAINAVLLNEQGNLEDDLIQLVDIALKFLSENQDLVKILFSFQSAERAYLASIRKDTGTTFDQIRTYLAKQQKLGNLRQDLPPQELAMSLNALLLQYALFAPIHMRRTLDVKKDSKTIVRLFLQGATNTGSINTQK